MKKPLSIPALIFAYTTAILIFTYLCPGEERKAGLIFQLVILWLATEAWNTLVTLPLLLFAAKAAKQKRRDNTNVGKLAKLTSPVLLVLPPLLYLVIWVVDAKYSGQLRGEFGFSDMGGLFKASYISVVWLFVCCLFSRVLPVSLITLVDPDANAEPVEKGMADTPQAQPQGQTDGAARTFRSKQYAANAEAMRKLLKDGEKIIFSTAPDVPMLRRHSGDVWKEPLICTVLFLVGLAGLVSFFMVQGDMKIFCGAAAVLGLIMAFWAQRGCAKGKRKQEGCDYFLTTERFCRLNTVDKPKSVFWKDKPRHHATYLPGSDVGNIHITPSNGLFSKIITTLIAEPEVEKSRTQGELDGMEFIHDCAAVYEIVRRLAGEKE